MLHLNLNPSLSELIEESVSKLDTGSLEDDFSDIVAKILELLQSYKGNQSQIYDYICRHLSVYCSANPNSIDDCYNSFGDWREEKTLTPPPMEAIIDLRYMSQWNQYLLWQTNVEERSVRKISKLTGISKSLIAEDLRYLWHSIDKI